MISRRIVTLATVAMVSVIQLSACGDGTEPPDPPRPATVTVSPATAELTALAATVQLMAEVLDQYGQVMAGAAVTWTSSGAAVATADASGLVTAADNGTATIKATAGEASGSATVTVAQKVSLVAVSPPADTVVERDTLRLSAEAMDANGHAVAEAEFTWASSDTLVAVVDDSGLVTGEAAGDVEVMATSSGLTGRAVLLVEAPVPTTVAVVPDSVSLAALGDTARLAAEVRDQIGRVMEGEAVSWTSGDTLVAAVDSVGLVMAVWNGVAAITARAGSASGSAAASVMQQARSVTVLPSSDTVALGDTARMAAEAFDENGYTVVDAAFTWSSSDTSVAPVDSLGLVRGIGEGVAAITATAGSAGGNATITVANPDRATLEVLFHAMDGPNWASSDNWLTDRPLSAWYGVRTGSGRVTHLQLIENNLSGPVPPELGDLTRLTYLQLDGNNLSDSIPPELGSLGGLAYLNLSKNRLTGSIPAEFAKLDALWNLDLAENGLTGSIPAELGSLDGLSILCLDGNNLTGSIPPELGSLESLHSLCLQHNNLTGSIPPKLGGLDGLSYLNLSWNALTGEIPPELGSLDGLVYLNLSQNGLTGSIPPEIGALGLGNLDLSGNNLTGPIPPELGGLTRLVYLVLYSNGLTGSIPSEFGNLTGLDKLYLGGNNLTGPIPTELGNLASLEVLSLHSNKLQGAVPLELSNLASLTSLNLGGNNLTGAIPAELGNLANLDRLVLWSNHLTGWIPPELGNLVNLTTLALGRNRLAGTIPPEFGHLTRLKRLYLDDTELTGTIPSTLLDLAELELVDFDGSAGLCVQGIVHFVAWWEKIADRRGAYCNASDAGVLEVLYRSLGGRHWTNSNRWLQTPALGEWHGVTADSLGRVLTLDLSRNALSGQLAPELGKLEVMTRLRIGDNSLSGRLPLSLARLTLSEFHYADTRLCVPVEAEFQAWLSSIASHAGTGMECGPLSDHDVLVALYFATGGWNWQESDNWLTQVPLEEWYGVGTDSAGRVTYLSLGGNELAGEIPRELGGLTNLRDLYLSGNQLTGEIPRELGGLTNLRVLRLSGNQLTGEIPPGTGWPRRTCGSLSLCGQPADGGDPAGVGWPRRAGVLVPVGQRAGGGDPPGTGWPHEPAGPVPRRQPADGGDPPGTGWPHEPAGPVPRRQPADGGDPPGTGWPHEPAEAVPQRQRVVRGDPATAGWPHEPAEAVPRRQRVVRGDPATAGWPREPAEPMAQRQRQDVGPCADELDGPAPSRIASGWSHGSVRTAGSRLSGLAGDGHLAADCPLWNGTLDGVPHPGSAVQGVPGSACRTRRGLVAGLRHRIRHHNSEHPACRGAVLPGRDREACGGYSGEVDAHPDRGR